MAERGEDVEIASRSVELRQEQRKESAVLADRVVALGPQDAFDPEPFEDDIGRVVERREVPEVDVHVVSDELSLTNGTEQRPESEEGRPTGVGAQDFQHLFDLVEVTVDGRAVARGERAVEPAPLGEGDGASGRVDDVDPVRPRPELHVGHAEAVASDMRAELDLRQAIQLPPDRLRPRGPANRGPVGWKVVGGQRPDPTVVEEHVENLAVIGAEREALVVHRERAGGRRALLPAHGVVPAVPSSRAFAARRSSSKSTSTQS